MTETLSRRGAAIVIATGIAGAGLALLQDGRFVTAPESLAKTVPPDFTDSPGGKADNPKQTDAATSVPPTETDTAIPSSETPTASPTVEARKIPTIEERKSLLANPGFFLEPQDSSGRIILTPQFADSEWERLNDKSHLYSADYKGNGCGASVIASVIKTMGFFHDGEVPNITNADIINFLIDKDHNGYHMIRPNNIAMQDIGLKWSMDLFGEQTGLFSVIGLTPNWGLDNPHVVHTSEWSGLFKAARENFLDKGGLVLARVLKYGRPPGSAGHFIIISSFNTNSEPLIVDSVGPLENHERQGNARILALSAYVERAQKGVPEWGKQPGLMWMAGVVPTF